MFSERLFKLVKLLKEIIKDLMNNILNDTYFLLLID